MKLKLRARVFFPRFNVICWLYRRDCIFITGPCKPQMKDSRLQRKFVPKGRYDDRPWKWGWLQSRGEMKTVDSIEIFTALFNNTRTLKWKAQPTNACLAGSPSLRLLPNSFRCLNCAQRFEYRALGSSRKLGGAGEHLIDGSEKRICRLSFEF